MNLLNAGHFYAITPCRNEQLNLEQLNQNLMNVVLPLNFTWIIVENNSEDQSYEIAKSLRNSFPIVVLKAKLEKSGLSGGNAYKAWQYGLENIEELNSQDYVMKLDGDVLLHPEFFVQIDRSLTENSAISGGSLIDLKNFEQSGYTQGATKIYSAEGLKALENTPRELGFDIVDEMTITKKGLKVNSVSTAHYIVTRDTGTSEGILKGEFRNGKACRWVGYNSAYYLMHLVRRSLGIMGPAIFCANLLGYLLSDSGPFDRDVRILHKREQRLKIKKILIHPIREIKEIYSVRFMDRDSIFLLQNEIYDTIKR